MQEILEGRLFGLVPGSLYAHLTLLQRIGQTKMWKPRELKVAGYFAYITVG